MLRKNLCLFAIGGAGYAIIELLWRGRTHPTMLVAGGLSFICFSLISEHFRNSNIFVKALLCSASVSFIELVFGILFNVILDMKIWDYSNQPLNLLGQICPIFSLLWGILAIFALPIADKINRLLEG